MPGNDNGDRLHNFFLQDNSSSVQHHQQIVDGSWSVVNNNLWVGNAPQFGVSSANTKIYNLQQSETDRGQSSHTLHGRGLSFTQPRSEFSNDCTFGSRINQTRQGEETISSVDTLPEQYNLLSRGLSMYESHQGIVPQHQTKPLMRSGTSESPVSFDLFGNQQQMHPPQFSMLHAQQQESAYGDNRDMHPLQQQIMFRKMQELQRQQQVRQLDNSQQNAVNPVSSFANQSSDGYPSSLVNSSPNSDSRSHHWGTRIGNMNWQHHASPVMQGSSNGLVYSSNNEQAHRLMDLVPQQSDQSLYGVPVSGSRGNVTQFPQRAAEKPLVQHLETFTNSLPGNQYTSFSEQSGMQDESLVSRHRFPGESSYERPGLTIQQDNSVQRMSSSMDIHQELSNSQSKVATLQNEVSLDPTEERILFGSDDNIFSDFCKNPDLSGDGGGPFDSFQNGTWSALMQSAVAETSSSDIQQQDELRGLSSQNTSVHPTGQHHAHSGKQEMSFHAVMPSSLNASVLSPDNDDNNSDYQNVLGVQQRGYKLEHGHGQRLQNSSFQREARNMSNHGSLQNTVNELRPMHENVSHSLDTESNTKNISGPWASTQGGPRREYGMSNGWNTLGSLAHAECEPTNSHGEKPLQHSESHEQKEMIKGGVHGGSFWNSSSMPNSSVEAEHAKSVVGNLPATRDGYSLSKSAGSPNLSNTRYNDENSQHFSNQGNYWKNVNPMVKSYGGENMEGSQHPIYRENQTVDSSLNSRNMSEFKSSQRETHKQKGNSKDSHTSNLSGNNLAGGMKETVLSDVSDSHSLPSRNQNLVNQIGGWKTSGLQKFQFHPMGDFEEVGPQYGVKQSSSGQVNTSQIPEISVEMEKGHLSEKNDAKDINNTLGNFHDVRHNVNDTYSSQNMLELLDKVDHSRDHGLMMHSSPSGHNILSEKHERDDPGGVATHLQHSQSSNSEGFGLQLGPPSHRMAVSSQHFLSQSNLQTIATSHQSRAAPEIGGNGKLHLPTSPSGQSLPFADERIAGELKRKRSGLAEQAINNSFMHKLQGNLSSASNSDFTYSSQIQYLQHMARTRGQVSTDQHDAYSIQKDDLVDRPSIGQTSQNSFLNARNVQHANSDALTVASQQIGSGNQHSTGWVPPPPATEPVPVPLPVSLSASPQHGTSLAMPANMWSNVPVQPNLFRPHNHKTVKKVPQLYPASVLESSSSAPLREAEQDAVSDRDSPSVSGASSMNRDIPFKNDSTKNLNSEKDGSQGMKPVSYSHTDGSQARTSMTKKDIEAFGRSLTSNNLSHQHYSLLNQVQAMKSVDPDTNDRALKKMKGLESSVEGQQLTPNAASLNVGFQSSASSGDSGVLSFSGLGKNAESKTSAQFGNVPAQNIVAHGQEDSWTNLHGDSSASPRVDHPHISPQMAPSWFKHYGTLRNVRAPIPKTAEQPFTIGKSTSCLHTLNSTEQVSAAAAVVDPGQHLNIPESSIAIEPESLQLNIPIHKKRNISWHKEVSHKPQTPPLTIRMAEEVWAKAVNRIPEMIEDEVDLSKNVTTTLRAKRRLTLTTHLMQQLLCPPMQFLLSSDAESACESVVYGVSRLALGEACGLVSHSSSDFDTCQDGVKLSSDKKSEKLNDRHLSVVMEDLRGRARNLETEFFRLDKRVSLADLRTECQELEKFSVINRFAKFHGRGQSETPNTSSLPDVTAKAPRPYLQRYVTALPVPRSLPDRVHCLPL